MHVKNFVICDREKQYAKNLLQMLAGRKMQGVQLFLFHTMDELKKFAQQKTIHILLMDEEYPQDQRLRISAKERYVLVKNTAERLSEQERGIYRYQSAGQIWRQIFARQTLAYQDAEIYRNPETRPNLETGRREVPADRRVKETKTDVMWTAAKTKGELIAVYSPIHRIGKTSFALELGKKLARKEPALYLNLEEYAGGAFYFPDRQEQNLADLLYYFRQGKENLAIRISAMAGQDGRLDYILPMPYVQDMQAVKGEEWIKLLERIREECIYEKVILDMGDSVDGIWDILEQCTVVYTPYIEDKAAKAKLNQYFENLRKTGRESILEKTIQRKMRG